MNRKASLALAWVLASAFAVAAEEAPAPAATAPAPAGFARQDLLLRLPVDGHPAFSGALPQETGTGGAGAAMMYPAPNAAGLLAAIITHSLFVESEKAEQKRQQQEAADKVLGPYRETIDKFEYAELQTRLNKLSPAAFAALGSAKYTLESSPVFFPDPGSEGLDRGQRHSPDPPWADGRRGL